MKPYQERVVLELNELQDKRDKLAVFLEGKYLKTINNAEKRRLSQQAEVMAEYAAILKDRIDNFE